jgi:hypothetical protein
MPVTPMQGRSQAHGLRISAHIVRAHRILLIERTREVSWAQPRPDRYSVSTSSRGYSGRAVWVRCYEAHDTTTDRAVALKILPAELSCDEGFRTRFQRESRAAAMLEEPHVIPIHDWGEIDGNLYIDMRWCAAKIFMNCSNAARLSRSARSESSARSEQRSTLRARRV